jgi:hypothetical protein
MPPPVEKGVLSDGLLLEIFQRLSVIETQNTAIIFEQGRAAEGRNGMYEKQEAFGNRLTKLEIAADDIKDIKQTVETVPEIAKTVENMKPIVDDYRDSRNKWAGIVIALTTIAGGIGFFASEIKSYFIGRH